MWRERAGGEEKRGMLGEAGMLPGTEETRSRSRGGGGGGGDHLNHGGAHPLTACVFVFLFTCKHNKFMHVGH